MAAGCGLNFEHKTDRSVVDGFNRMRLQSVPEIPAVITQSHGFSSDGLYPVGASHEQHIRTAHGEQAITDDARNLV